MILDLKPEDVLPDIVGQKALKSKLAFHFNNYGMSNVMPHLYLIAPKGCGKTTIARKIGHYLTKQDSNTPKTIIEVNASTILSRQNFFDTIVTPYLTNTDVTLFVDEAHKTPDDVQDALLTILNPSDENRSVFLHNGSEYVFDFKRISFIFASTDIQGNVDTLRDRFEILDFQAYTRADLTEILIKNLGKHKIEVDLDAIINASSILRGNPRSAQKMSSSIRDYLLRNKKSQFTNEDWQDIAKSLDIKPLGLTSTEIRVLEVLKDNPNCSLTRLSAKLGATRESLQKYYELHLQKNSLIEIGAGSGRNITMAGRQYLEEMQKIGLTS